MIIARKDHLSNQNQKDGGRRAEKSRKIRAESIVCVLEESVNLRVKKYKGLTGEENKRKENQAALLVHLYGSRAGTNLDWYLITVQACVSGLTLEHKHHGHHSH